MIDHEAEVKKIYPDAKIMGGGSHFAVFATVKGVHTKISWVFTSKKEKLMWQVAYNELVSQGLIIPQTTSANEKTD